MSDTSVRRILMTGDTIGGVWTFCLELASQLSNEGVEICLATLGRRASASQKEEAAAIPGLTLHDSALKLEWMDDPWRDVELSRQWIAELAAEFHPDVIHLNTYGAAGLALNAPVVLTAHSCVCSWWTAVKNEPLPAEWMRYRKEVASVLPNADVVAAPSQAMLNALRAHYSTPLPQARVIRNGRRAHQFQAGTKEPFILAAGRLWDCAKNIGALARIAPHLSWPVYLAGECGGAGSEFKDCHLLGTLPQHKLAQWYSRAAIYALPARYEPFGLSALEAALSGCALVLGDIPSLREIWGEAAIFVPPGDAAALHKAITLLIDDPEKRERISRAARTRAGNYRSSRMAAEYQAAYHHAARRRRACAA